MTEREILIAARKLIERPEAWTTRAYARDSAGSEVHNLDPRAVCWCSVGALRAADDDRSSGAYWWARKVLSWSLGRNVEITDFNDTHTHAEVLAAFDRAIEACP